MGNSLTEKAFLLKKQDAHYMEKFRAIEPYLLKKISQGDLIAYALYYVEHESKLERIEQSVYTNVESYLDFVKNTPITTEQSNDPFFDYKIEYISQFLGESVEC